MSDAVFSAELFENTFMRKVIRGWPQGDRRQAAESLRQRLLLGETQKQAECHAVSDVQALRLKRDYPERVGMKPDPLRAAIAKRNLRKVYNRYGKQVA